jgi:hypothetical protein
MTVSLRSVVSRSEGSVGGTIAGALVIFACLLAAPGSALAQAEPPSTGNGFDLEQNYPNPFNPETTIPFTLREELFASGRPVVVSVRIFNLLGQPVAYPVALQHSSGPGVEVNNLDYTQPGRHEAYWDGTDQSGRPVASGIYFMQLTVNGQSVSRKMYALK